MDKITENSIDEINFPIENLAKVCNALYENFFSDSFFSEKEKLTKRDLYNMAFVKSVLTPKALQELKENELEQTAKNTPPSSICFKFALNEIKRLRSFTESLSTDIQEVYNDIFSKYEKIFESLSTLNKEDVVIYKDILRDFGELFDNCNSWGYTCYNPDPLSTNHCIDELMKVQLILDDITNLKDGKYLNGINYIVEPEKLDNLDKKIITPLQTYIELCMDCPYRKIGNIAKQQTNPI